MLNLKFITFHLFVTFGIYSIVASIVWIILRHIFPFLYSFNRQVCKKFVNKFYCRSDFYIYWNWGLEFITAFCPLDLMIQLSTSIIFSYVSIAALPPGTLEVWKISIFNQWLQWFNYIGILIKFRRVIFCVHKMKYRSMPISFLWVLGVSVFTRGQLSHQSKVRWHWLRFRLDSSLSGHSGSLSLTPAIFDSSVEILLSIVLLLPLILKMIRYTRLHTSKIVRNKGKYQRCIVIVNLNDLDKEMYSYKVTHFLTISRYPWFSFMVIKVLNLQLFH